jgi:TfoX/Sxy family transcriptional regulator of competence genes
MSKWKKASPELVEFFLEVTGPLCAENRKMFGYPCCFMQGNMFTGLAEENWIVRLDEEQRAELCAEGGHIFEPFEGRKMREYVVLPKDILEDRARLRKWINASLEYALGLPPKLKKKRRARSKV